MVVTQIATLVTFILGFVSMASTLSGSFHGGLVTYPTLNIEVNAIDNDDYFLMSQVRLTVSIMLYPRVTSLGYSFFNN